MLLQGTFVYRHLEMQWTSRAQIGERRWMFELTAGDIAVSRRYPKRLSEDEAAKVAETMAPELFRVAEAWLEE